MTDSAVSSSDDVDVCSLLETMTANDVRWVHTQVACVELINTVVQPSVLQLPVSLPLAGSTYLR
jgi:hypothetical protein